MIFGALLVEAGAELGVLSMYRVGLPGWKIAARLGVPVKVRVNVHHDADSNTYWAESPDLDGLVVAGETLDELHREVIGASHALLELAVDGRRGRAQTEIRIKDNDICLA